MSGSGLLGGGFVEPILAVAEDLTVPRPLPRRMRGCEALQRGRGPGSTAVGPRKGEEKALPPRRVIGNIVEL